MNIRVKMVDVFNYKDKDNNKYTYYILKTCGYSFLYWLMINGRFKTYFINVTDMLNDISYRRLIKL